MCGQHDSGKMHRPRITSGWSQAAHRHTVAIRIEGSSDRDVPGKLSSNWYRSRLQVNDGLLECAPGIVEVLPEFLKIEARSAPLCRAIGAQVMPRSLKQKTSPGGDRSRHGEVIKVCEGVEWSLWTRIDNVFSSD